jgi:phosphate transport system substrate-binding protein
MKRQVFGIFAVAATISLSDLAQAGSTLNGAGATFPAPLYSRWVADFEKLDPAIKINYQPIGSGGGIKQFIDGTVDFAGTDAPMTDEQIAKVNGNVLHIPTALGAVVMTYNVPGLKKPLKLTAETTCAIALGKITVWNDKRLALVNPGVKLPADALTFVHRADGSGTSAIFTDYLSKVCPEWKEKVGSGTAVNWPAGLGGKGNDGVSGLVKQTPGAIGYVELIFAEKNRLPVAMLKNKSGEMVAPSVESVTAALAGSVASLPADYRLSITDSDGKKSYPIAGMTYLLVRKSMPVTVGTPLVKFIRWALKDGQKIGPTMSYSALPEGVVAKVEKTLEGIELK